MAKTKTDWEIAKRLEKNAVGINCSEHFRADKVVMEEIAIVRKTRHAKYNINYHIVWIPKTRAKILNQPFEEDIKKALKQKCEARGCGVNP
ncbi:MAG: transposase [Candidatus Woesearchaeota archaeon]